MTQYAHSTATSGPTYDCTLILAVEISNRSWVVAAQVPGLRQKGAKQQLAPRADALMAAIEGYKRRATAAGMAVDRVIVAYESGGSGFWLARWLAAARRRGASRCMSCSPPACPWTAACAVISTTATMP